MEANWTSRKSLRVRNPRLDNIGIGCTSSTKGTWAHYKRCRSPEENGEFLQDQEKHVEAFEDLELLKKRME